MNSFSRCERETAQRTTFKRWLSDLIEYWRPGHIGHWNRLYWRHHWGIVGHERYYGMRP